MLQHLHSYSKWDGGRGTCNWKLVRCRGSANSVCSGKKKKTKVCVLSSNSSAEHNNYSRFDWDAVIFKERQQHDLISSNNTISSEVHHTGAKLQGIKVKLVCNNWDKKIFKKCSLWSLMQMHYLSAQPSSSEVRPSFPRFYKGNYLPLCSLEKWNEDHCVTFYKCNALLSIAEGPP